MSDKEVSLLCIRVDTATRTLPAVLRDCACKYENEFCLFGLRKGEQSCDSLEEVRVRPRRQLPRTTMQQAAATPKATQQDVALYRKQTSSPSREPHTIVSPTRQRQGQRQSPRPNTFQITQGANTAMHGVFTVSFLQGRNHMNDYGRISSIVLPPVALNLDMAVEV